jgi:succinate-semialdehyde dehydrogenase/glutarate-semialdehyde dehydrogenase
MDAVTTLGPMSSEAALVTIEEQVDAAVQAGATVITGGKRLDRPGSFFAPTILADVARDNPAYQQEFFGPVALFFSVADDDDAVRLANDSEFGLGCSIFTADLEHGDRLAGLIESGMVFINHPTWTAADLPFGGVKTSGYGRELSAAGIHEFVNKKLVRVRPIDAPA